MKKNILLISLSVMFFSCASQLDEISQSDKYVEKSIQYYKNKKYSKARDRFQNIINNNLKNNKHKNSDICNCVHCVHCVQLLL